MGNFRFEKIAVWERAVDFADLIYMATNAFPADERFGLTNQMRRAAVSISSNIAEGSGRGSDADFARFIEIAYGSLMEVTSQSYLAARRGYVTETQRTEIYECAQELARMLSGFRASLRGP